MLTSQPEVAPAQRTVDVPGVRLAVRDWAPSSAGRPFLLVHGLASNARLWDGVARRLAAAGHRAISVDQRGHGLSDAPAGGYDTDTCADDLAALVDVLDLGRPVVAGQSWGGNVVLSLAARHPGVPAAVACVDGGWLRPRDRFATFEECWAVLEPPRFDGRRFADLVTAIRVGRSGWSAEAQDGMLANLIETADGGVRARLDREHHRSIVRSLFDADPERLYPAVRVPVSLLPAFDATTDPDRAKVVKRALALLPDAGVHWYPGADHDVHAQQPDAVAEDLLDLARRAGDAERKSV